MAEPVGFPAPHGTPEPWPVVVVGAGPAGLATARELAVRAIPHRVFERGPDIGWVWRNLYDSLTLHTGKHLSALPGLRFPRSTPLFPSRTDFVTYLERYRETFGLVVETSVEVRRAVPRDGAGWAIETSAGTVEAAALVMATGIVSRPVIPDFEGAPDFGGRILHSVEYLRPEPFSGRHVLVVGCGNSGAEIASELASAGASVTVAVRTGANVVPLTLFGIPIQYVAHALRGLPRPAKQAIVAAVRTMTELRRGPPVLERPAWGPLDRIPLIGFHLVDAIRAGRVSVAPGIHALTATGARFTDGAQACFDDIILATGFRPALEPLEDEVRLDEAGFAARTDRVTSADRAALYFVGHNYDSTGGLMNIARDAPAVAERIGSAGAGRVAGAAPAV